MNQQEFAQKIKTKYPQYQNVNDEDLTRMVLQKYPQYQSQLEQSSPTTSQAPGGFMSNITQGAQPPSNATWYQKLAGGISNLTNPIQQGIGLVKGATETFTGLTNLVGKGIGALTGDKNWEQLGGQPNQTLRQWSQKTNNVGQGIGKFVEGVGEVSAPTGALEKYATSLPARMGIGALTGGMEGAAKSGDLKSGITPAILGGMVPISGSIVSKVAPEIGNKIEMSLIKPTQSDIKDGFNINTINKYDLGGSLQDTSEKTHTMITDLASQLKKKIAGSDSNVDILDLLSQTEKDMLENKSKTFGSNSQIRNVLNRFTEDLSGMSEDGRVDLVDAQQIKRSLGKMGAWQYGKTDPESTATEAVANNLYSKLKTAIEKAAPDGVKEINKQLSELIPVENALIRRMPVAERANAFGLTDAITAIPGMVNPSNWWLFALNRLSKSGKVAGALVKTGKDSATPIGKVIFGK